MNGKMYLKLVTTQLFVVASSLFLYSCGNEGEPECSYFSRGCEEEVTFSPPASCNSNDAGIVDGCGEVITILDIHDPVILNLQGLAANTTHSITILNTDTDDISTLPNHSAGSTAATSDGDGNIFMSTIVQNMPNTAVLGEYNVSVVNDSSTVVQSWNYTVANRNRVQCTDSSDPGTAIAKASFTSAENVYAVINSTLADGSYNAYVISDSQTSIPDSGVISETAISITLSAGSGGIDLGTFSNGSYDVLVDVNNNGIYERDTDLISRHARQHPCFVIQNANSGAAIIEPIAADRQGNKREIFDPDADKEAIRDIFANLIPAESSANTSPATADVYVVNHQNTWLQNDALVDLSGSTAPDNNNAPVQNDTNAQANMLQWSFSNLAAGCYDIVVDTDRNGVFTEGSDFVDNVNHLGDGTDCGFRVSTPDSTNVTITSHTDNETTTSTALDLAGMVNVPVGTLDAAYIRISSGTQTNIISLDGLVSSGGGSFSAQVPLYSGNNYITVSGLYSNNTSMSETIMVRSVTDLALFRAQLTWDGSTDMDLHLVRPNGSYSNGGGGEDDCNYSNCRVGAVGAAIPSPNLIDWGEVGIEDDDPKLDVDCVSCGNGIENIWMNEINENGVYKVYVDAFSGNENNSDVIVNISILGSTVGVVNCGHMQAGTSTDTCYVGDITWVGGTSGAGNFRPVGSQAADY